MPRLIDLSRKIKDILQHVQPLPPEAIVPLFHYQRTKTDIWSSLVYVENAFDQLGNKIRPTAAQRHLERLYGMSLVQLVQAFERFLKEIAAACVDHLARFILDDRFNVFNIQGSGLASHFGTATLGKALCETSTWLDCDDINQRFRRLLSDPFQQGGAFFHLFPRHNQEPAAERGRYEVLSLVWQLRHAAVHNSGVITQSDAVKLRLWAKEPIASPRVLLPTRDDIRYLRRFLDETAASCNQRIGQRLADLLTALHQEDPTLFVPPDVADALSQTFGISLTVAGAAGVLPPP